MTEDEIQQRREQASNYRGVWYDVRADKFAAEVYSKGDRHFLGHFATASEAGDAYAKARAELPTGRSGGAGTFAQAFEAFLSSADRDKNGTPERDSLMTYKEQEFIFQGVEFRFINKRKRPFYAWLSACCECGASYETLTATSPDGAKGITRRCEEHRKPSRYAKKDAKTAGQSAPQPNTAPVPSVWLAVANEVAERLSVVADNFHFRVFFDCCRQIKPDLPRDFFRFLTESPQSPVVIRDEKLFLRDV